LRPPENILEVLKNEDSFLILTHSTPDGDALGSSLALKFLLRELAKKAEIFTEQPIPSQYKFLPEIEKIKNIRELPLEAFKVLILVDCNNPSRVDNDKKLVEKIERFSGIKVIIDHHIEDKRGDFNAIKWIEPEEAATGIMIYKIIKAFGINLDYAMATALYTAIIIDTGNFQFDNTSEHVLTIAAELVRAGAKPSYIYEQSFESWSLNRFNLFVNMLTNVEITPPLAVGYLRKDDFEKTGTEESDTERFVEFLRTIKDVTIAALFREIEENFFKVSLRSKGSLDVNPIARAFGGGGHKNASGYRIRSSFEEAKNKLIEVLKSNQML